MTLVVDLELRNLFAKIRNNSRHDADFREPAGVAALQTRQGDARPPP